MRINSQYYPSLSNQHAKTAVLIHGLFGDKDNLTLLRKTLMDFNVLCIDLPNHGSSSHITDWNFELIVDALQSHFHEQGIAADALIGHSLGGKVAMAYALKYPSQLKALVIADIAPVKYNPQHQAVFDALNAVELDKVTTRNQAFEVLTQHLEMKATAQFLLKGLTKNDSKWTWKFNLTGLQKQYTDIIDWPFESGQFLGPTLFIKGQLSDYIKQESVEPIRAYFPNAEFKVIEGTGHWLHAEKPNIFNRLVIKMLNRIGT